MRYSWKNLEYLFEKYVEIFNSWIYGDKWAGKQQFDDLYSFVMYCG